LGDDALSEAELTLHPFSIQLSIVPCLNVQPET